MYKIKKVLKKKIFILSLKIFFNVRENSIIEAIPKIIIAKVSKKMDL